MKNELAKHLRYCPCCDKWMNSFITNYHASKVKVYLCCKCFFAIRKRIEINDYNLFEIQYFYIKDPTSMYCIYQINIEKDTNKYCLYENVYNQHRTGLVHSAKDFGSLHKIVKKLIKNKDLF